MKYCIGVDFCEEIDFDCNTCYVLWLGCSLLDNEAYQRNEIGKKRKRREML